MKFTNTSEKDKIVSFKRENGFVGHVLLKAKETKDLPSEASKSAKIIGLKAFESKIHKVKVETKVLQEKKSKLKKAKKKVVKRKK